ncbi:MAG: FAD-binding protein [Rhodospirillaceae bacterium]
MIATIKPTDDEEVLEAINQARARQSELELIGAGTKRDWGRPHVTGSILDLSGLTGVCGKKASELTLFTAAALLDLTALVGVVAYEPLELTVTARPGTRVAEVETMIAADGQYLAFEPPDFGPLLGKAAGRGTLGGVLACNLTGPSRIKAGLARDHFVAVKGVNGRGEIFGGGGFGGGGGCGGIVKDVSGLELPKLMAGSFGTLAAFTELTIKVLPRPETERTMIMVGLDDATAVRAFTAVMRDPHNITGAAHLPFDLAAISAVPEISAFGDAVTAIRVEGFSCAVASRSKRLCRELADYGGLVDFAPAAARLFWREIANAHPFVCRRDRSVWRLTLLPATAADTVATIR